MYESVRDRARDAAGRERENHIEQGTSSAVRWAALVGSARESDRPVVLRLVEVMIGQMVEDRGVEWLEVISALEESERIRHLIIVEVQHGQTHHSVHTILA